ncbi:5-formyltetrahydrofolate cyclo-ligase [Pedobacter sp. UYP24]
MNKHEIRVIIKEKRRQLLPTQIETYSLKMLEQFSLLDLSDISTLHIFLPIVEKKEPDTFLFIQWINNNYPAIKIVVPRADFENSSMTNIVYEGQGMLKKNHFHIPEPQQGKEYQGEVDLVIVPLLAFDKKGYRVGYGKGFYDRYLQNIATLKVGLCFFEPVSDIEDTDQYDIRLNVCITPTATYRFKD